MIPSRAQREAFPPLGIRPLRGRSSYRLPALLFVALALAVSIYARVIPSSVEEVAETCANGECVAFCQLKADLSLGMGPRYQPPGNYERYFLIHYDVTGNEIAAPRTEQVPGYLIPYQTDEKAHQRIWNLFTALIPAAQRDELDEFALFTGGEYAGQYDPASYSDEWALYVNIEGIQYPDDLTYTLVHEFGHRLTLSASQRMYISERNCEQEPLFGCPRPDSYLNLFFETFWTDIYAEWEESRDDLSGVSQMEFYQKYRDQFVSAYATTNPIEDIAESWTTFVLSPKPDPAYIANRKVLFFYDFPELVELRYQIIYGLCSY